MWETVLFINQFSEIVQLSAESSESNENVDDLQFPLQPLPTAPNNEPHFYGFHWNEFHSFGELRRREQQVPFGGRESFYNTFARLHKCPRLPMEWERGMNGPQ